jgi:hypothetical protein
MKLTIINLPNSIVCYKTKNFYVKVHCDKAAIDRKLSDMENEV